MDELEKERIVSALRHLDLNIRTEFDKDEFFRHLTGRIYYKNQKWFSRAIEEIPLEKLLVNNLNIEIKKKIFYEKIFQIDITMNNMGYASAIVHVDLGRLGRLFRSTDDITPLNYASIFERALTRFSMELPQIEAMTVGYSDPMFQNTHKKIK